MSVLAKRGRGGELADWFSQLDRVFEEWMRSLPMRRPMGLASDWPGEDIIRVDEFREGNVQVIRAELPGVDPDKDIQLTLAGGMLRINAERRVEEKTQDTGYRRHELRYGSFTRTLPLPESVQESDISANYRDGILEIRVSLPEAPAQPEPKKISIGKS